MFTALLSIVLLAADAGPAPSLNGAVYSTDSKSPVPSASIIVYSAAPAAKDPPAAAPPQGYSDVGKSVSADGQGQFNISGVDPSLNFQLLVSADGYRPLMLKKVDPARGAITARLKPIPKDLQPELMLKGHVIDADGKDVSGARIEAYGMQDGQNRNWGGQGQVIEEGPTYTDAKGNWLLIAKKANVQVDIKVTGRGIAPTLFPLQSVGDQVTEMTVTAGATLTGRIVKDGKGIPNLPVHVSQKNRDVEHWVGDGDTTTDADGRFVAHDLKPDDDYLIYGTMNGLAGKGAMTMSPTRTGDAGASADAGDLNVEKGYTVAGQLFCSDGKPVPAGTKARIERWEGSDSVEATVGKDGKYEFKAIPGELMEFSVEVNGYHVSDENESFEPANARWLLGLVDQDITDLRVQLDPGPDAEHNYNSNKWNQLQTTRLTGVVEK